MPIYVYKNLNTGERFEIEQRITEPALNEHPKTGDPVKRLVQPVGIAFKGSGFYATDSRAATRSAPAASSGADVTPKESGSATASEGASAAKPEAPKDADKKSPAPKTTTEKS